MKEEILQIASDLREGHITSNEAKEQLLRLFGVSSSFSEEYSHNCMMYLDKQRTCMVCGKQNCC
jgi:hypothetical protein